MGMIVENPIIELAKTSDFHQTVLARPPRIVHGTLLAIVLMLCAAIIWAYFTDTEIVVRAPGRIRPLDAPHAGINDVSGERISAFIGGEVAVVNVAEGDKVKTGDVLLQLDTRPIDNELSAAERELMAARDELTKLDALKGVIEAQYEAERGRLDAELARTKNDSALAISTTEHALNEAKRREQRLKGGPDGAESEVARLEKLHRLTTEEKNAVLERLKTDLQAARAELGRMREQRTIRIEKATMVLNDAKIKEERFKKLLDTGGVVSKEEYEATVDERRKAELDLAEAEQAIDESRPTTIEKQIVELDKQYAVKLEQLAIETDNKREEAAAAEATRKEAELKYTQAKEETGVKVAEHSLDELAKRHQRELADYQIQVGASAAKLQAATSKKDNLNLQRDKAIIRAAVDGTLTTTLPQVGDVVQQGQVVATIARDTDFRIDALVAAHEVGKIKKGMPCRVKLDAFDYQKYGTLQGEVVGIAADTTVLEGGASVYLVKVKITGREISSGGERGTLKLGMTGTAEIITEVESLLGLAFRALKRNVEIE
ncbi:MAG: HlyD family secretion protein [Planctomycetes bacterium]|nr:HlyD family secretion protein [Planctomycetota bacterium]NUQ35816.1 HlyD family efflux transporter periplasmic adaptor subunit [Planctomycetaceae bacterium]